MQVKTRDQSTDISVRGLTVDGHRQMSYCTGHRAELLSWEVRPELQPEVIKELEDVSSEDLYEVIAEALANDEDEAQSQSSEDDSTDETLAPVVDDRTEHDDGYTSVQCTDEGMGANDLEVQEEQDDSTSVPVGQQADDIPLIKVNFI